MRRRPCASASLTAYRGCVLASLGSSFSIRAAHGIATMYSGTSSTFGPCARRLTTPTVTLRRSPSSAIWQDLPLRVRDSCGKEHRLTIPDVRYVPSFVDSLISTDQLWETSSIKALFHDVKVLEIPGVGKSVT